MRYFFLSSLLIAFPLLTQAQEYVPLIGIPGLSGNDLNVNNYIQALYILAISLAAFGAVIRLILAGLKYIVSDVVTVKGQGEKGHSKCSDWAFHCDWCSLGTKYINPQLTQLNALNFDPLAITVQGPRAEVVTPAWEMMALIQLKMFCSQRQRPMLPSPPAPLLDDGLLSEPPASAWVTRQNQPPTML